MAEPILVLDRLRKAYGALTVTDDLSMTVAPGSIHALIGPNGAGKTTLIGQISGQIAPDAGRIRFAGRDITDLPMHARCKLGLARSFQITTILPGFSTLENVAVAAQAHAGHSFRFLRPAAAEAELNDAAMAALETVGLTRRAGLRAGSLSHGEKRQLEIAIALVMRPKLLLLDEPSEGVQPSAVLEIAGVLADVAAAERMAVVLVEQNIDLALRLTTRAVFMDRGRVVAEDLVADLRDDRSRLDAHLVL